MTNLRDMAAEELARLARSDQFDEGFWQRMFDLAGRNAYRAAKDQRRSEARMAAIAAKIADAQAVTVEEKRAARKLTKRASVLHGLERLYERDSRKDPMVVAYRAESKWVSDARDLGVMLVRWRQGDRQ